MPADSRQPANRACGTVYYGAIDNQLVPHVPKTPTEGSRAGGDYLFVDFIEVVLVDKNTVDARQPAG